ncbi:hypothetical protein CEP51_006696 [Fusarium floridanum]|uniref:Dienelactone hydrolase domain-containing protein n=1 Tax=Fusarium floridanum TaxID=1325733 RepID=A0A428RRV9_9HYPO|nr:hypothetical protein CEP51_006696 [Fusarium floridanum]
MSCPDCFKGSIHDGEPRGRTIRLHDLDTYVVEPSEGKEVKGIAVVIPDAFGWEFVNCRLLADNYADKSNYKVYLPDFMIGDAAPLSALDKMHVAMAPGNLLKRGYNLFLTLWAVVPFMIRNRFGKTYPIVKNFFEKLRKSEGAILPVGVAGFCWGGKLAILLSHGVEVDGKPIIDAAFTGHPSGLSFPGDFEKVTVPLSVAVGDIDSQFPLEMAEKMNNLVESKPGPTRGEVKIYPGAGHGFCVRASMEKDGLAEKASAAEDQAIAWFNTHFKVGS